MFIGKNLSNAPLIVQSLVSAVSPVAQPEIDYGGAFCLNEPLLTYWLVRMLAYCLASMLTYCLTGVFPLSSYK